MADPTPPRCPFSTTCDWIPGYPIGYQRPLPTGPDIAGWLPVLYANQDAIFRSFNDHIEAAHPEMGSLRFVYESTQHEGDVMPGPIRPDEVETRKTALIPDEVFEVFNELIARAWNGRTAVVKQDEVVERLEAAGFDRDRIFAGHWLDVENAYQALGWVVAYRKPGIGETGQATFTFTKMPH